MAASTTSDTGSLLQGIADDVTRLIEQQFQMMRSEFAQELGKLPKAALSLGTGTGLVGLAGVLGTAAVVHLVHDATRLPLWVCYGMVAGLLGAAGAGLLTAGVAEVSNVRLIPPRTADSLRQDVATVQHAVAGATR